MDNKLGLTAECYSISLYIIEQMNKNNEGKTFFDQKILTKSRLVRILYFCDILHMKLNNGQAMFEDNFDAWSKGPSIPTIYDIFKYENLKLVPYHLFENLMTTIELTEKHKKIINEILNITQNFSDEELENISKDEIYWQFLDPIYHLETIPKTQIYNFNLNRKSIIEILKQKNDDKIKKLTR